MHWRVLSFRTKWQKLHLSTLLSNQSQQQRIQQRRHHHIIFNYQTHYVLSFQSGIGCTLLWLQTCRPHLHNSQRNGTSTAQTHHDHHQQHHCQRPYHGHHDSKGIKIDGSMLPFAQMPQCTKPIPLPVALRHSQLCQLCKQASSRETSPSSPSILHPKHSTTTMNYTPLPILMCFPCFLTSWFIDPSLWHFLVTSQACTCKGVLLSLFSNQDLSRTQKSSNRSLLYQKMFTRSGSNLVLRVPKNFCSYTCNNIY